MNINCNSGPGPQGASIMRRTSLRSFILVPIMTLLLGACGDDEDKGATGITGSPLANAAPVAEQYAKNVHANYVECLDKARALKTAIDAFVDAPSAATQEAAK